MPMRAQTLGVCEAGTPGANWGNWRLLHPSCQPASHRNSPDPHYCQSCSACACVHCLSSSVIDEPHLQSSWLLLHSVVSSLSAVSQHCEEASRGENSHRLFPWSPCLAGHSHACSGQAPACHARKEERSHGVSLPQTACRCPAPSDVFFLCCHLAVPPPYFEEGLTWMSLEEKRLLWPEEAPMQLESCWCRVGSFSNHCAN
mmetsp:Transcript_11212/g.19651  ORF Transcript_11212/g.19651 Transcript_11212/m.19651 type:complete len:201 (-) Transcript_11212:157-759(-)